jgi:carbonic anhydrase
MRSLALACAVKGGKEIAIIGHTDCLVAKTSTSQLLDRLRSLGVERHLLPDNINEYFGIFASERQNVQRVVEIVRHSPLIGPRIPVQGVLVDIATGKLEWLVNGYQTLETAGGHWQQVVKSAGQTVDALKSLAEFKMGEMKFPETKIGEIVTQGANWLSEKSQSQQIGDQPPPVPAEPTSAVPLRIPLPPPLRPRVHLGKSRGRS